MNQYHSGTFNVNHDMITYDQSITVTNHHTRTQTFTPDDDDDDDDDRNLKNSHFFSLCLQLKRLLFKMFPVLSKTAGKCCNGAHCTAVCKLL